MIILNFSHPLTDKQEEQIKLITNVSDTEWNKSEVLRVNCYIDINQHIDEQIEEILSRIPDKVWSERILIVPPPISYSATLILVGIFSKCGYFPNIIRIKKRKRSSPPEYVIAEIIETQSFKDRMRAKRENKKIVTKLIGENKNNGSIFK